jgi:two-component system, response regulator PhcR
MRRLLPDPVITNAGVCGFGVNVCNRVMQSLGRSTRIAPASGAGTTVTLEFPNFKDRMNRSYP